MTGQEIVLRLTALSSIDTATTLEEVMGLVFHNKRGDVDLNSSVYLVSPIRTTQIKSEHSGNAKRKPETRGAVIISEPFPHPEPHNDGGYFSYRSATHHEIRFSNEQQAEQLAAAILENLTDCVIITEDHIMYNYIKSKICNKDLEWFEACLGSGTIRRWVAQICSVDTNTLNAYLAEHRSA